jgi:predicted secreted protein
MATIATAFTEFQIQSLAYGERTPQEYVIEIDSVDTNAKTMEISGAKKGESTSAGAPTYLQAGLELEFSGGATVSVAEDLAAGETTLKYESENGTDPTATESADTFALYSFLGGESLTINNDDNVVSIRTFRSGMWAENAKTMIGASMDLEGTMQDDDIALMNVIRPAAFSVDKEIYAQVTRPNGDVYTGAFLVQSYSEPNNLDNVVRVSFTLNSQGAIGIPAGLDTSTTELAHE